MVGRREPQRGGGRWSVRGIATVTVAVVVALDALAVLWGHRVAQQHAVAEDRRHLLLVADTAADEVARTVATAAAQVTGLVAGADLTAVLASPGGCTLAIDAGTAFPGARLSVVSADGSIACSSADVPIDGSQPHAGAPWLGRALASDGLMTLWDTGDRVRDGDVAVVAHRFHADDGTAAGAVALFLPLDDVAGALAAGRPGRDAAGDRAEGPTGPAADTAFFLVDTSSRTIASPVPSDEDARPVAGDWDSAEPVVTPDGVERHVVTRPVEGTPWAIAAGSAWADVVAHARSEAVRQALVGLALLAALVGAGFLLHRTVVGPLRRLTRAVEAAATDPDRRVPEAGAQELRRLGREFNALLDVRAGHEARHRHAATHDDETGLLNAPGLVEHVDTCHGGSHVLAVGLRGLVHLDVDGTDLPPAVRIAAALADAAGPTAAVARTGEAVLTVCVSRDSTRDVDALAHRLAEAVDAASGGAVRAAIGVATHQPGTGGADLVRRAATALSAASAQGRVAVRFEDSMHERAEHHARTELALRRALTAGELVVHYQPIVDVADGTVLGVEALVRWERDGRLVPPLEFVPVAEASGLIGALGAHVLREACRQSARWRAQGHDLLLSVNVAAGQLVDGGFVDVVERALAESGLPPDRLCLEITESALVAHGAGGQDTLLGVEALGVRLAVDDFGTGYSSLAYLRDLPVTEIKVDRGFVAHLGHDPRDTELVASVVAMGRALGMAVVAEGVETQQQLDALRALGCDMAQGYLLGRPGPAARLEPLLRGTAMLGRSA
ncbi:putative bifunctional diguanylate cyclase/phosphodiesterase [Cellulomonas carbonis]|uniref:putative bifunctional diguanylate cyclase/phosphodiesterase n=1 Tax=Cellulomonas carbonis TaxID=1386092 RepID=UPI00126A56FF|nr:EAL domain-containing protein [Cellulomonas carbonis]